MINLLRDDKDSLVRDLQGSQSNNRQFMDLQEKQQMTISENKRIYNEIDDLKRQIQEMNFFIEQQKQDLYNSKHQLIEKAQREQQLHIQLENSYSEIVQLKGLLQRAETQLMNKTENLNPPVAQPIPYGGGDIQYSFKTLDNQDFNKRNQQTNNRSQLNNSYNFEKQTQRRRGPSNERIHSQSSLQNLSLLENDSRAKMIAQNQMATTFNLGSENMQETPINKNKQKPNHLVHNDARQISAENNLISQQLKNKNTNTPSNFLSWEVPEQNSHILQNNSKGLTKTQFQNNPNENRQQYPLNPVNQNQNQDYLDKMYITAKQQLDRDQKYVNQQYSTQQNLNSEQNNQHQQNQQHTRGQNQERNPQYSQYYNDYLNDRSKNSPPQDNKKQNQVHHEQQREPHRNQVDPQQQIKNIESNLMMLNVEKDKVECYLKMKNELQKLEEAKLKSAQNIRRRNEITEEIQIIDGNISLLKTKLREMNALHPY